MTGKSRFPCYITLTSEREMLVKLRKLDNIIRFFVVFIAFNRIKSESFQYRKVEHFILIDQEMCYFSKFSLSDLRSRHYPVRFDVPMY